MSPRLVPALGAALLALAAPARAVPDGAELYTRCAGCHAIEGHRTGPEHCGLFGRRAGTAPGYADYTPALRRSRIVWNERSLERFLKDPLRAMPGTAMGYAGIKDAGERAALIAWLREATRPGVACTPTH